MYETAGQRRLLAYLDGLIRGYRLGVGRNDRKFHPPREKLISLAETFAAYDAQLGKLPMKLGTRLCVEAVNASLERNT